MDRIGKRRRRDRDSNVLMSIGTAKLHNLSGRGVKKTRYMHRSEPHHANSGKKSELLCEKKTNTDVNADVAEVDVNVEVTLYDENNKILETNEDEQSLNDTEYGLDVSSVSSIKEGNSSFSSFLESSHSSFRVTNSSSFHINKRKSRNSSDESESDESGHHDLIENMDANTCENDIEMCDHTNSVIRNSEQCISTKTECLNGSSIQSTDESKTSEMAIKFRESQKRNLDTFKEDKHTKGLVQIDDISVALDAGTNLLHKTKAKNEDCISNSNTKLKSQINMKKCSIMCTKLKVELTDVVDLMTSNQNTSECKENAETVKVNTDKCHVTENKLPKENEGRISPSRTVKSFFPFNTEAEVNIVTDDFQTPINSLKESCDVNDETVTIKTDDTLQNTALLKKSVVSSTTQIDPNLSFSANMISSKGIETIREADTTVKINETNKAEDAIVKGIKTDKNKKSVTDIKTSKDEDASVIGIETNKDEDASVISIETVKDNTSAIGIETIKNEDTSAIDIETVQDNTSAIDTETIKNEDTSAIDIETVQDNTSAIDIETIKNEDTSAIDIETVKDNTSATGIETIKNEDTSAIDTETVKDNTSATGIETIKNEDTSAIDIETNKDEDTSVIDIETNKDEDTSVIDIETNKDEDTSVIDIEIIKGENTSVMGIETNKDENASSSLVLSLDTFDTALLETSQNVKSIVHEIITVTPKDSVEMEHTQKQASSSLEKEKNKVIKCTKSPDESTQDRGIEGVINSDGCTKVTKKSSDFRKRKHITKRIKRKACEKDSLNTNLFCDMMNFDKNNKTKVLENNDFNTASKIFKNEANSLSEKGDSFEKDHMSKPYKQVQNEENCVSVENPMTSEALNMAKENSLHLKPIRLDAENKDANINLSGDSDVQLPEVVDKKQYIEDNSTKVTSNGGKGILEVNSTPLSYSRGKTLQHPSASRGRKSGQRVKKTPKHFEDLVTPDASLVSPKGKGRKRIKIAVSEETKKPFTMGWSRQVVYRAVLDKQGKRMADIYYFNPEGGKLRSMPEIAQYLAEHPDCPLTLQNFTFFKEPIYRAPFETERQAKARGSTPTDISEATPALVNTLQRPVNEKELVRKKTQGFGKVAARKSLIMDMQSLSTSLKNSSPSSKVSTPNNKISTPNSKISTPSNKMPTPSSKMPTPSSKMPTPSNKIPTPSNKIPTPSNKIPTPSNKIPTLSAQLSTPSNKISAPSTKLSASNNISELSNKKSVSSNKISVPSSEVSTPLTCTSSVVQEKKLKKSEDKNGLLNKTSAPIKKKATIKTTPKTASEAKKKKSYNIFQVIETQCSIHCYGVGTELLSLQCEVCLCLFHPQCVSHTNNTNTFVCKRCLKHMTSIKPKKSSYNGYGNSNEGNINFCDLSDDDSLALFPEVVIEQDSSERPLKGSLVWNPVISKTYVHRPFCPPPLPSASSRRPPPPPPLKRAPHVRLPNQSQSSEICPQMVRLAADQPKFGSVMPPLQTSKTVPPLQRAPLSQKPKNDLALRISARMPRLELAPKNFMLSNGTVGNNQPLPTPASFVTCSGSTTNINTASSGGVLSLNPPNPVISPTLFSGPSASNDLQLLPTSVPSTSNANSMVFSQPFSFVLAPHSGVSLSNLLMTSGATGDSTVPSSNSGIGSGNSQLIMIKEGSQQKLFFINANTDNQTSNNTSDDANCSATSVVSDSPVSYGSAVGACNDIVTNSLPSEISSSSEQGNALLSSRETEMLGDIGPTNLKSIWEDKELSPKQDETNAKGERESSLAIQVNENSNESLDSLTKMISFECDIIKSVNISLTHETVETSENSVGNIGDVETEETHAIDKIKDVPVSKHNSDFIRNTIECNCSSKCSKKKQQPAGKILVKRKSDDSSHLPGDHAYSRSVPTLPISAAVSERCDSVAQSYSNMNRLMCGYDSLNLIFQQLEVIDLLRASQVCRSWRRLASQYFLWKKVSLRGLYVRNWSSCTETLDRLGTRVLDLQGLQHTADTEDTWQEFVQVLDNMQRIRHLIFGEVPPCVVSTVTSCLPFLHTLESNCIAEKNKEPDMWCIPCKFDFNSLTSLRRLEKLKLRSAGGLYSETPLSVLGHLSHLQHLSLTTLKNAPSEHFNFLNHVPQLATLELGDCINWKYENYMALSKLQNLHLLRLENGGGILDFGLAEAVAQMKHLQELQLINFKIPSVLGTALLKLSSLCHLSLWPDTTMQAPQVNFNAWETVSKVQHLSSFCWGVITPTNDQNPIVPILKRQEGEETKDSIEYLSPNQLLGRLCTLLPEVKVEVEYVALPMLNKYWTVYR